jgi:hypothetical protein
MWLGLVGVCAGVFFDAIILPAPHHSGELSKQIQCASNLRGIMQSMVVYAAENNDLFPVVTYAPYSAALNSPTAGATAGTAEDAMKSYYGAGKAQAGSVAASAWILVLNGQVRPKEFVCRSDPFLLAPAKQQDGAGRYYDNFQDVTQLSYSFAYPWKGDGTVGGWWRDTELLDLPLAADQAPEEGTGTPARVLTGAAAPRNPKAWNSVNHLGDGQNVGYADAHAEFWRKPTMGQRDDNIFTTSAAVSAGPGQFGGVAASRSRGPVLSGPDGGPFDVVMYPVRNATTGR